MPSKCGGKEIDMHLQQGREARKSYLTNSSMHMPFERGRNVAHATV